MANSNQESYCFESEKVDRLVELAVEEVLRNQNIYHQYLKKPDIWLHDGFPEILLKINQNKELIPHKNLETKDELTLAWAIITFKRMMQERSGKDKDCV